MTHTRCFYCIVDAFKCEQCWFVFVSHVRVLTIDTLSHAILGAVVLLWKHSSLLMLKEV